MILAIGEILFDIFPHGRRLGGAPFNFAFHIHRLGAAVRFLSRIGRDAEGRAILDYLQAQQFPTDDLQIDKKNPTGRVAVTLDAAGSPRFEILPGMAYDAISATAAIEAFVAGDCRLIYFGTLIQRTPRGARTVQRILERRSPGTRCLCDINLRPGCYTADVLSDSLAATDILKLNEEELAVLAAMNAIGGNTEEQVAVLRERFAIEVVALTRGPEESSLFVGDTPIAVAPPSGVVVKDTLGAGDAFAAVLAIGCLADWAGERTLTVANQLAAAICGIEGAVPVDPSFYSPFGGLLAEGRIDDESPALFGP